MGKSTWRGSIIFFPVAVVATCTFCKFSRQHAKAVCPLGAAGTHHIGIDGFHDRGRPTGLLIRLRGYFGFHRWSDLLELCGVGMTRMGVGLGRVGLCGVLKGLVLKELGKGIWLGWAGRV